MKKLLSLLIIAPLSCQVAHADSALMQSGQWQDSATGLIWTRCNLGQTWSGGSCNGTAQRLTWQELKAAVAKFNQDTALGGKRNWRLPNIVELSSIRYCSEGWRRIDSQDAKSEFILQKLPAADGTQQVNFQCAYGYKQPTIDGKIFPKSGGNSNDSMYWSSTEFQEDDTFAWGVNFAYGFSSEFYKYLSLKVRLVRN